MDLLAEEKDGTINATQTRIKQLELLLRQR